LENIDDADITRAWETVKENIKISPKGFKVIMNRSHGLTEDVLNFYIKGNKPNYNGYRIQAK
jgi:hypothetical protein